MTEVLKASALSSSHHDHGAVGRHDAGRSRRRRHKVERPDGGDPFRSFRGGLYSPHFIAFNRNKRSVVLDLQTEAGKASLRALLAKADVLLDNYRSGVMDRLGLSAAFIQTEYPS